MLPHHQTVMMTVIVIMSNTFAYITVRPQLKQVQAYEQSDKKWFAYIRERIFVQITQHFAFDTITLLPSHLQRQHHLPSHLQKQHLLAVRFALKFYNIEGEDHTAQR